jgi:hypothetical protein
MREEIFGPLLPSCRTTTGRRHRLCERATRPLALTSSTTTARRSTACWSAPSPAASRVNETLLHIAQDDLPFGGVGPSGWARITARGFDTFSKLKPVFHQPRLNGSGSSSLRTESASPAWRSGWSAELATRRQFLKVGLAGAAVLATVRYLETSRPRPPPTFASSIPPPW